MLQSVRAWEVQMSVLHLSELEGIATSRSVRFSFVLFLPNDSRSPLPPENTVLETLHNKKNWSAVCRTGLQADQDNASPV